MASNSSSSPEAGERQPTYVGFWKRVFATIVDTLVIFLVMIPLLLAVYGRGYFAEAQEAGGFIGFWDFLVQVLLPAAAVILFWKYRGATPGKMAISARIVDARTGRAPSTGQLVGRYFGYFVSILPLGIGLLWVGIDRRKQGFHDKLAKTMVIYDDEDD